MKRNYYHLFYIGIVSGIKIHCLSFNIKKIIGTKTLEFSNTFGSRLLSFRRVIMQHYRLSPGVWQSTVSSNTFLFLQRNAGIFTPSGINKDTRSGQVLPPMSYKKHFRTFIL